MFLRWNIIIFFVLIFIIDTIDILLDVLDDKVFRNITLNIFYQKQIKGNSELPPGAQGIGDVLSHLCKLMTTLHVVQSLCLKLLVLHVLN